MLNGILFNYKLKGKFIGSAFITFKKNKKVKLEEIRFTNKFKNKGYGSNLIEYIINYLKYHKYKLLYGNLCPENNDKFCSLIKFYARHKFKIIKYSNGIFVKILLNKYII
jgi:ribosomal protein S18 acetylase RimI-like enzyme